MVAWEDVVKVCETQYSNCHSCPIRGACWEEHKDKMGKGRTSDELERDMIEALKEVDRDVAFKTLS